MDSRIDMPGTIWYRLPREILNRIIKYAITSSFPKYSLTCTLITWDRLCTQLEEYDELMWNIVRISWGFLRLAHQEHDKLAQRHGATTATSIINQHNGRTDKRWADEAQRENFDQEMERAVLIQDAT
ncbi:MAG: hypothetical protein Q9162_001565, partial [Coniocarpon cinnabarinum]